MRQSNTTKVGENIIMVEVGQFYVYHVGDISLYVRVTKVKGNECTLLILKPTHHSDWKINATMDDYNHDIIRSEWTEISSDWCLLCLKWNPCRASEVVCWRCR